jgi:demethylmenaquinone methyltransferase/2-methoxy-6-polyprenyl-1,4-benzoquinol methylase
MNKKRFVYRSFAAIAGSYDLVNTLLSFGLDAWWRHEAIKALRLSDTEADKGLVLDCCAGTMRLSQGINSHAPRSRIVSLDFSLPMLDKGRRWLKDTTIMPLCGDAEQLPFYTGTFDRAIVGFGIRNLSDPRKGIEELARVLKRKGRLVILEFGRPTIPLFKNLYQWYLSRFIPLAGGIISGHKDVYRYLHSSIMDFPEPHEMMAIMRKTGFPQISYRRLTGGIANLYIGEKI